VKHYLISIIILFGTTIGSLAQVKVDSVAVKQDSVLQKKDTISAVKFFAPTYRQVLLQNPYFNFFEAPIVQSAMERPVSGKEALFYLLSAFVLLLAFVKTVYSKYFANMFTVAFSASLKQKQLREQLMQAPLPSLFLNILFVFVLGVYISFLIQKPVGGNFTNSYWLQLLYCIGVVAGIYLVKFVVITFSGWVFNIKDGTNVYLFIVFLVNKLIGIFLLPFLIIMAFAPSSWWNVLITLSYILLAGFLVYRYAVSYGPVRREVKVSQFHFFVYLCAFEIVPMIVIYREILNYI
jgi:Domain of unknown function (DUF4271)